MTVAFPRPARLLLALLAAALLAGCGSSGVDERRLIAQSRAAEMVEALDRAERELQAKRCGRATNAVESLRAEVEDLPQRTDGQLVANLTEWVTHLEQRVPADCEAAREAEQEEEETPTPTPTKTPDEDEEDEEETPTPTPTPTVTATPIPEPTPVPTVPPTGGGSGGSGEGGQGGGGDEGSGGDGGGGSGSGSDQPSTGGVPPGDEASP